MARIDLQSVTIEYPIYNANSRSFKKKFIRMATGGNVTQDANQHIVVRALDNISLAFEHGDRIGLVGHNGSGKSTFLRLLAGIYEPSGGEIRIQGSVSSILDIMSGTEAEFSGYENIYSRCRLIGLSKNEIKQKMDDIAQLTGLGDYLAMPVRTYSSGMIIRLAFAISTSIRPEILLIDEVFGTGDADFLDHARQKIVELLKISSIVVLATHSDDLIKEFCNKALLLEKGKIKYFGDVDKTLKLYHAKKS